MNAWLQKLDEDAGLLLIMLSRIVGTATVGVTFIFLLVSHFVDKDSRDLSRASQEKQVHSELSIALNQEVLLSPQVKALLCLPNHPNSEEYYFECKTTSFNHQEEKEWWVKTNEVVYNAQLSFKLSYEKKGEFPFLFIALSHKGQRQISRAVALDSIKKTVQDINEDLLRAEGASKADTNEKSWKEGDINGN